MLIYISGNYDNSSEFVKAEVWLLRQDHKPINTTNLVVAFPYLNKEQTTKLCYNLLEMADGIYMLHDWQKSKGAIAELSFAKSLGKKVIYQDYYGRNKKGCD